MKIELTTEEVERLCKCIYFSTFEDDNVDTAEFHARRILFNKLYKALREAEKAIPQGEWIWLGDNPNPNHKWSCNKCGRGVKEQENFCPNCGANMGGK